MLLLLPQRQEFSSKSQRSFTLLSETGCCCCYHKGRNFQANHNLIPCVKFGVTVVVATTKVGIFKQITTLCRVEHFSKPVVVATTKVGIFKQITTFPNLHNNDKELLLLPQRQEFSSKSQLEPGIHASLRCCCCYHKGRNFQANHNSKKVYFFQYLVVVATTKVGIFKQITTIRLLINLIRLLLLLPQRQEFSSKSQPVFTVCLTFFVVVATTKVGIFKQITTKLLSSIRLSGLLLLPQRQEFSSKSQQLLNDNELFKRCCCYHKGRNFQANHNGITTSRFSVIVVVATTKVGIFKQITTVFFIFVLGVALLLLPQRQEFSSKSQRSTIMACQQTGCCCYHKGRNFQANHNPEWRLRTLT